MNIRDRLAVLEMRIKLHLPQVRVSAERLVQTAGSVVRRHAPALVTDLAEGRLPEVEAVMRAAAHRVAPGVTAVASVAAAVVRRKRDERR